MGGGFANGVGGVGGRGGRGGGGTPSGVGVGGTFVGGLYGTCPYNVLAGGLYPEGL